MVQKALKRTNLVEEDVDVIMEGTSSLESFLIESPFLT